MSFPPLFRIRDNCIKKSNFPQQKSLAEVLFSSTKPKKVQINWRVDLLISRLPEIVALGDFLY